MSQPEHRSKGTPASEERELLELEESERGEDAADEESGEQHEAMAVAASGVGADLEEEEGEAEAQAKLLREVEEFDDAQPDDVMHLGGPTAGNRLFATTTLPENDEGANNCITFNVIIGRADGGKWREARALLDSGASNDFVARGLVSKMGWSATPATRPLKVQIADGRCVSANQVVDMFIDFPTYRYRTRAYVLDLGVADCEVVLGASFFRHMGDPSFQYERSEVSFSRDGTGERVYLYGNRKETAESIWVLTGTGLQAGEDTGQNTAIVSAQACLRLLKDFERSAERTTAWQAAHRDTPEGEWAKEGPMVVSLESVSDSNIPTPWENLPFLAEAGLSPQATRNFIVVDSSVTQALADTNMDLIIRTGKAGKPNSSKVLLKTAQNKTAVGTTGDQKTANGQGEGDPAVLAGITVDDEDDWRARSVEGQAVSAPPPPVPLPNDHPLRELVTAILEGRIKDGASVKPELW